MIKKKQKIYPDSQHRVERQEKDIHTVKMTGRSPPNFQNKSQ